MKANFGFSFHPGLLDQASDELLNRFECAEAVFFNREDLHNESWNTIWKNLCALSRKIPDGKLSFHFPVNECDYVADSFVRSRLSESFKRAEEIGIKKITVHSNRVYPINRWAALKIPDMRSQVIETLERLLEAEKSTVILCLENMPPIGNKGDDADPLFLFCEDFESIRHPNLKITFDISHYFNVAGTMCEILNDKIPKSGFPVIKECDFFDFKKIMAEIHHWHFSAFKDYAIPFSNIHTTEGLLPAKGTIGEEMFRDAMEIIIRDNFDNPYKTIVFEVRETDYIHRSNVFKMLEWAESVERAIQRKAANQSGSEKLKH